MFIRIAAVLLSFLGLSAVPAAPPAMPLEEVRAGQRGTGLTVFEGVAPVEFDFEVLGVHRGGLGAGRHLIIVRLLGERLEHTGVVAGMSGSPVTIDGRLVGALSYRIGSFAKDPIAGITPFAYMQEIPPAPSGEETIAVVSADQLLARTRADSDALLPPPAPRAARIDGMAPIANPLLIAGARPELLKLLGPSLQQASWAMQPGGTVVATAPAPPLSPGDAVAAILMEGDLTLAASGTVTSVQGGRVLAFGHPFLRAGETRMPMARVDVITTVASQQSSYKLGNIGATVGMFDQDRMSGIAGTLGPGPELVPISVTIRSPEAPDRTRRFRMIDHPAWSPFLAQVAVLTTSFAEMSVGEEVTVTLSATLELEGLGEVRLHEAYAQVGPGPSPIALAAGDVGRFAAALLANRFQPLRPLRLDVTLELVHERRYWLVQQVHASRRRARPGEELALTVRLEPYRGEVRSVTLALRLPEDLPTGPLEIVVGGAAALDRLQRNSIVTRLRQIRDVSGLRDWIAALRSSDQLYALARRPALGGMVAGRELPRLPDSALQVLREDRIGFARLLRATVAESSRQLEGVVLGARTIHLEVLPASDLQERP